MRSTIIACFFSILSLSVNSQVSGSFNKIDSLLFNQYYSEAVELLEQEAEKDTTAFRAYNKANRLDPENSHILYALGEACINLGALTKAVRCYFTILKNDHSNLICI